MTIGGGQVEHHSEHRRVISLCSSGCSFATFSSCVPPLSLYLFWPTTPVLIKLEAYRLHKAGYEVAEIVKTFGYTRQHWRALWGRLKREGTKAFNNKNYGSVARKRTTKTEAAVIRAKVLSPEKSDDDLGKEFGMERTTIYRLLKEHGIQDLHKAIKR